MRAAVVSSFGTPPEYAEFPTPAAITKHDLLVDVIASGLHPRVRSQADGSHYTSTDELPLVPGIDGVGRAADGQLYYFLLPDTTFGAMAERTVIDRRRSIPLAEAADPFAIAAVMNPAMSAWIALRRRIDFAAGQSVLVLGATGSSGRLAVQVAKHLGAGRVIAAGRDPERLASLASLGADETVSLQGPADEVAVRLARAAADVDVAIDYLWGDVTTRALTAIATRRTDAGRPLTWIEIGSMGGATATIPSAALRAIRLGIVGSGQGSVPTRDILSELPALATEITAGTFVANVRRVPLADVAEAWTTPERPGERVVIVP